MADEMRCHGCGLCLLQVGGGLGPKGCPRCGEAMAGYTFVRRPDGAWTSVRDEVVVPSGFQGLLQ